MPGFAPERKTYTYPENDTKTIYSRTLCDRKILKPIQTPSVSEFMNQILSLFIPSAVKVYKLQLE